MAGGVSAFTVEYVELNNLDKQHAWTRIWSLICSGNPALHVTEDESAITAVIEISRLQQCDATLDKLNEITASTPEPSLFTDEELVTLRILVSTAVWIRSEQLAHPNAFIIAPYANEAEKKFDAAGVSAMIDTHNMHIHNLRHEFEAGQKLFTKLAQYCSDHGIADPEWRK